MVRDVGGFDQVVHLIKIVIGRMQTGEVVEHKAFKLFFPAGRVVAHERTDADGVLCPLSRKSQWLHCGAQASYNLRYR